MSKLVVCRCTLQHWPINGAHADGTFETDWSQCCRGNRRIRREKTVSAEGRRTYSTSLPHPSVTRCSTGCRTSAVEADDAHGNGIIPPPSYWISNTFVRL
eukprot:GHVT01024539.1.p3 GENE.GHVT01024539.1~~GHVT01024539.1.p3  ORF type:complete len:100 (-),score=2.07 GHVT01024539.1:371-670(-)